ncbi:Protein ccc1 [Saxophila tyrrhenica]|uniref:Protein ccc1 n=1 Tax=Saxophila tyrrhenica TaxID=1690608 RepID=A0AAV9PGN2_9PEZI|nr:Protein ccc1 [Saxophila tyrrhenica]
MNRSLTVHPEPHKTHGVLVRDSIIGFSDGLTVPFALTAGLSSLGNSKIVILGGIAELFAGSISMGLGAYLASTNDKCHYDSEERRERQEVKDTPEEEEEEIYVIFEKYGISRQESRGVVEGLKACEDHWVQFMMDFELRLDKPSRKYSLLEGLVMGISYFVGGLLPMIPYFIYVDDTNRALNVSIGIAGVVLCIFGIVRARLIGASLKDQVTSAIMTMLLGGIAAGGAYGIVYGINKSHFL